MKHDRIRVEGDHLPADFYRAQALINATMVAIQQAQVLLSLNRGKLTKSTADGLFDDLRRARQTCINHFDNLLAAPASGTVACRDLGRNGKGPRIEALIRSVERMIAAKAGVA